MVGCDRIANRIQNIASGINLYAHDILGLYVGFGHELEHQVDRRMREDAARIRFDRDSGIDDAPDSAKFLRNLCGAHAAAMNRVEAPRTIQSILIGGKTARRKQRSGHAIFGRTAYVERLCHGAKVTANSGSQAGDDTETATQLLAS